MAYTCIRMGIGKHIILVVLFSWFGFVLHATGITGMERYYDPLDKLASNPVLLSRNKEVPTPTDVRFPFSVGEYPTRMAKLGGFSWDPQTASHLNKLTGPYGDKMYDALGIYAELQQKITQEFKQKQVSEHYQMLAPMLSGMNLHYVSAGGKRGIWQLDIVTATRYGLKVSDARDDRDDPILSAAAAAAYIKDLQSQFKSPEAILWAYVSSPAEVRRAFARAESTDPQKALDFLPLSVRQAVPVFSAWSFIWSYSEKDNLPVFLPAIFLPSENAITAGKTHLGQISELLEIPVSSLKELNPSLKKMVLEDKETVHLPQGYASRFLSMAFMISKHKDSIYFQPEVLSKSITSNTVNVLNGASVLNATVKKYHKVKSGETLSQLAQKYHVSVSAIKKWNHMSSSSIKVGQKLVVQMSTQNVVTDKEDKTVRENVQIEDSRPDSTPEETLNTSTQKEIAKPETVVPKPTAPKPKSAWTYHTVRSGETLSSIGRKYGVSYTKIKEWNGLRSDNLGVGQKLKIKK